MPDIIKLLPDTLANQIAAGEVIQRPASAVKEMLENAVDAGADRIHLIIKDAGKELIQVIDNGKGMSATDARMSFERHATSKIKELDDLFAIRTMGFRGEALASMAAVSRVELKTKQLDQPHGSLIKIENGSVISQDVCQCPQGTSISLKNLFYNVPARRQFLKTNTTEMRHIVDEFTRVALAFPEINFKLTNQTSDLFHLEAGSLKQRILQLITKNLNDKLVKVEEITDFVSIKGFCGTPDAASKTRGQQFFFVNNRYIRSPYLNHAIKQAYKDLLPSDNYPFFVLFIDLDPARVDINVHPTKQEIKFDDDRIIYAFVNSAMKESLSRHSVMPSLDFNVDASIENLSALTTRPSEEQKNKTENDYLYQSFSQRGQAHFIEKKDESKSWKELYKITEKIDDLEIEDESETPYQQIDNTYIVFKQQNKLFLIHQQYAHERILYEQFNAASNNPIPIQQCLIEQTWEVSTADALIIGELLEELKPLGFQVESFGKNVFIIQGVPGDLSQGKEVESLEKLIEAFKFEAGVQKLDKRERLWRSLARQKAIPVGKKMFPAEMESLVQQLFTCSLPTHSPDDQKTMVVLSSHELEKLFH